MICKQSKKNIYQNRKKSLQLLSLMKNNVKQKKSFYLSHYKNKTYKL